MEDRRVHLAVLVERTDHVCCRYRFAALHTHLEAAGYRLDLIPFPKTLWDRLHLFSSLAEYDGVILQRRLLPSWMLRRLRRAVRQLFFDFDDAIYLRDSYDPRGLRDPRRLRRFAALCSVADGVIAGNEYLAEE